MPRNLKYLVPLLAALGALLVPLGASARLAACESPSCLWASFEPSMGVVQPGSIVKFTYIALPTNVANLTATAMLPPELQVLQKGSSPFHLVDGRPTWDRKNLNTTSVIHFNTMVKKTARRGKRVAVTLHVIAQTGDWQQVDNMFLPMHIAKHK